jgi:hypothetical protein
MKKLLVLAVILISFTKGFSQNLNTGTTYKTAIGVKVYPGAITVKHFVKSDAAIEGIGYFYDGFRFTGLYEFHGNINGADGLKWYIGPGLHTGYNNSYDNNYKNEPEVGIDGILGLDYKIKGAPIDISFDWQPSFNIFTNGYFRGYGGLAFRFTL